MIERGTQRQKTHLKKTNDLFYGGVSKLPPRRIFPPNKVFRRTFGSTISRKLSKNFRSIEVENRSKFAKSFLQQCFDS